MGQTPVVVNPRKRRVMRRIRWRGLAFASGEIHGGLVLMLRRRFATAVLGSARPGWCTSRSTAG